MRPVDKNPWPLVNGHPKAYNPHTIARTDLETNLDCYCSYCEVFSSDLEVEHVISQNQDNTKAQDWNNFLLACGRCNGRDNKSNKPVDVDRIHFPHRNNTFLSFSYLEGGIVTINPALVGDSIIRARALLKLVGLDKYQGNPDYPNLNQNDTRWRHRRTAWEWADRLLIEYEAGEKSALQIVNFASQRGFFSVWFSVFINHIEVKQLLVNTFVGTSLNCFDPTDGYKPIPRNPHNAADPI